MKDCFTNSQLQNQGQRTGTAKKDIFIHLSVKTCFSSSNPIKRFRSVCIDNTQNSINCTFRHLPLRNYANRKQQNHDKFSKLWLESQQEKRDATQFFKLTKTFSLIVFYSIMNEIQYSQKFGPGSIHQSIVTIYPVDLCFI